mgnify:CR=1 FL=1
MTIRHQKILATLVFLLPFIFLAIAFTAGNEGAFSKCGYLLPLCFIGEYLLYAALLILIPFPTGIAWFVGTLILLLKAYVNPEKPSFKRFYLVWTGGLIIVFINAFLLLENMHIGF